MKTAFMFSCFLAYGNKALGARALDECVAETASPRLTPVAVTVYLVDVWTRAMCGLLRESERLAYDKP